MRTIIVISAVLAAAPAYAGEGDRWDGVTMAEQAGAGALGGVVVGFVGLLAGAGIGSLGDSDNWDRYWSVTFIGAYVGASLGVGVGVKLAGDHENMTGSWGATLGGAAVGGLLTMLTMPSYGEKMPGWATITFATTTMLLPAIVGYHLSSDAEPTNERRVMIPLTFTF